jgi:uncharacterized membrane protein
MIDLQRLGRATGAFLQTWRNGNVMHAKFRTRRYAIRALCIAGIADSGYVFLYQTGTIHHLACPFFGSGCERISSSKTAHPFGVPDAILGVAGYSAMLLVNERGRRDRSRKRPLLPLLAFAGGAIACGASAFLTWRQWKEFHTFCFWCLTSAAISTAIFPLTWAEAEAAWKTVQHRCASVTDGRMKRRSMPMK